MPIDRERSDKKWGRLAVDFVLVVAKDDDRRRRLLQTLEQVDHLCFLFDVLDLLDNVERGGTGATDVDEDRLHERGLGKVLDSLRHSGREEERLTLVL